jgi:hypothetical protein
MQRVALVALVVACIVFRTQLRHVIGSWFRL